MGVNSMVRFIVKLVFVFVTPKVPNNSGDLVVCVVLTELQQEMTVISEFSDINDEYEFYFLDFVRSQKGRLPC